MLRSFAIPPGPRAAADVRATLVETSTTAARWIALVVIALVAAPAAARAAASTPCPGVRFLVTPALVPGGELATDAVVLDADGTLDDRERLFAGGRARRPARRAQHAPRTVDGVRRSPRGAACARRSIARRAASSPVRSARAP
jgi:hypothetical protein